MTTESQNENRYRPLIIGASIIIPLVVAILYFAPTWKTGIDFGFLPPFYAGVNATTAIVLLLGLRAILKGNVVLHKRYMSTAILLSVVFLLAYILYHLTKESTVFGGTGIVKTIYYCLLLSHILLSVAIVPLVLITYTRALSEKFDKHKRIAKITLPIWLYVAISGVVVYFMISPYYV
jgi:putative membrane protein